MNDNVNGRLQRVGNCGAMLFSVVNTSLDLSAQIEGWSAYPRATICSSRSRSMLSPAARLRVAFACEPRGVPRERGNEEKKGSTHRLK